MLAYFFVSVSVIHDGSSLSFIQHSIIIYFQENMIYLSAGITKKSTKWILLVIMSAYFFIYES